MTEAEAKVEIFETLLEYIQAGGREHNAKEALDKLGVNGGEWHQYRERHLHSIPRRPAMARNYKSRTGWEKAIKIFQILNKFYTSTQSVSIAGVRLTTIACETLYFLGEGGDSGEGVSDEWKLLRHQGSVAAKRIRGKATTHSEIEKNLTYEHAIPRACWLYPMIKCGKILSADAFKEAIQNNCHIRIVTRDEDTRLVRSDMPDGCGWGNEHWFEKPFPDIFVRYKKAGIQFDEGDLQPYSILDYRGTN